jgi:Concanavalin A-like lectin/glucanases superfamily
VAIGVTQLGVLVSDANTTSYNAPAAGTFAPAADSLVVVGPLGAIAATPSAPTITGFSVVWNPILASAFDTTGTQRTVWGFYAQMPAAPGTDDITVTFPASMVGCGISVHEVTGHNPSTPIRNIGGGAGGPKEAHSTGNAQSVTMDALADAANAVLAFVASDEAVTFSVPGGGFTLLGQATGAAPVQAIAALWKTGATNPSTTSTGTGSQTWGMVAFEIQAAPVLVEDAGVRYRVAFAFGIEPDVEPNPGDWEYLDRRIKTVEITRGRNRETVKMQPARVRLRLDDPDRDLEPEYASSPFHPNVVPVTHVKIEADWTSPSSGSTTTYPRFQGTVDDFMPLWDRQAVVEIPCTDVLPDLQAAQLRNPYVHEVLSDSPTFYYRMNDPAGATQAVDYSGNIRHAGAVGSPVFGVTDPITDSADGAVTIGNTANYFIVPAANGITGSGAWWIGGWYRGSNATATTRPLWLQYVLPVGGTLLVSLLVGINTSGQGYVQMFTTPGPGVQTVAGAADLRDGAWHYLVASRDSGGTTTLFIDGSSVGSVAAGSQSFGFYGGPVIGFDPTASSGITFDVDEIAGRIGQPINLTRVQAHYDARNAWLGQRAGARIASVFSMIGWAGAADLETGISTLQSAGDLEGKTALAHIQEVEDWEQGMFFVAKDGTATFYDRHHAILNTTSVATFGDAAGELRVTDVIPESSNATIHNEVKAQRIGGPLQVVRDQASIDRFKLRTWPQSGAWSLGIQSDAEALQLAYWRLAHDKDPLFTIRRMTCRASDEDAMIPTCLGLELGDRVTVNRRPHGGDLVSGEHLIQGYTERWGVGVETGWEMIFHLSPAETQAYWILDTSELGTDTTLAV